MISPPPLQVPISAPTGGLTAAWIAWFDSLRKVVADQESAGDTGPDAITAVAALSMALASALQELQTLPRQPVDELSQEIGAVKQELQTLPRPELGTFAALQQANLPWTTFDTTPEFTPPDVGTLAYGGGVTLGFQATANVVMRLGETEFVYVRASSAITKGQLCYHTGAVGASGVITAAPSPLALVDSNQIVGVAAETIALNDFGLIQISGTLRGFNTTGSSVGEAWADGDPLYYNPAFVGSMTKVKPSAPNQKSFIGEVINAGSGGSGSMSIRIVPGSTLGGTDSNVQITGVANNDVLVYDSTDVRWENKDVTTTFNLPALAANGVLYLNGSKVATSGSALVFDGANLGIGTATPTGGFRLDVQATTARQRIESTTGTNEVHQRYVNTGGTFYAGLDGSTGSGFGTAYGAVLWHTGNYPMLFATNNAERARITANGNQVAYQPAESAQNTSVTLTVANLQTRIITSNAAVTLTLPTGTSLEGYTTSMATDTAFECTFIATTANAITIGANGNTTVGSLTVAGNSSGLFRFRKTATNTFTVYRIV